MTVNTYALELEVRHAIQCLWTLDDRIERMKWKSGPSPAINLLMFQRLEEAVKRIRDNLQRAIED